MYLLSNYNYSFERNGKIIVFNTYTQALAELEKQEYIRLINLDETSKYKESYINLGYWVNYDERKEILQKNREAISDTRVLQLVIRMTDACNFRCPYCYQEHEKVFLDGRKRDILKKFIYENLAGKEKVYVHYFGGEPLLNVEGILDIDKYIRKCGVEYNASLTTNAYLLNSEMVLKLNETNISTFQITLDGPPEIHNQTRVLRDGKGTFEVILSNIKGIISMTNADIKIRFNCGKKNTEYAKELLSILAKEKILENSRVKILFQQLHNYSGVEDNDVYYNENEYFPVLLGLMNLLRKYGKQVYKFGPIYNACALFVSNAYVIGPDLELEVCTTEERRIGVIDKGASCIIQI